MLSNRKLGLVGFALLATVVVACGDIRPQDEIGVQQQALGATVIVAAVGTAKINGQDAWVEVIVKVPAGPAGRQKALDARNLSVRIDD